MRVRILYELEGQQLTNIDLDGDVYDQVRAALLDTDALLNAKLSFTVADPNTWKVLAHA